MRLALLLLMLCVAVAALGTADAQRLLRWGERRVAPAEPAGPRGGDIARPAPGNTSELVALRTLPIAGGYQAIADNRIAGPVEVRLAFERAHNVQSQPLLPTRQVLRANASALIATLGVLDAQQPGDFELRMEAVPGDPRARPADFEYLYPLPTRDIRIDQGFGGSFSHSDVQNRFAIDIATPVGSPVLAAREGVVMEVEQRYRGGGPHPRFVGRVNTVRLLHDDGAMSVYAHLKHGGIRVRPGQRVKAGEVIALSGDTGYVTGPHLHFVVQVNRGMSLESIAFRMRGPKGPMRLRGN